MKRGGQILSAAAVIGLAACSGQSGELEVRAIPRAIAPGAKPLSFRLAEAHGQLALGNVALALESYRKAMREDPNSTDALAGMAVSYDRMGRFDLSRRYYEAALAIEPGNPTLLAAFAGSLDMQGKRGEAANVRSEIAARVTAVRPRTVEPVEIASRPVAVASAKSARLPEVDFRLAPEPVPTPALAPARTAAASARPIAQPPVEISSVPVATILASRTELPVAKFQQEPDMPAPRVAAATSVAVPPPTAAPVGRSVTVTLPPPRPAAARPAQPPVAEPVLKVAQAPAQAPIPAPVPVPAPKPEPAVAVAAAPPLKEGARLERLSLTEVALVTSSRPQWRPKLVAQGERTATVRFVPLRQSAVRTAAVLLLNAARHQGLAARTRGYLVDRGWRSLAIGDAAQTRAKSVVLYPASYRTLGLRVAAQFGFAAAPDPSVRKVMVLLGRDATALRALRPSG